jgi:hypothetical protein
VSLYETSTLAPLTGTPLLSLTCPFTKSTFLGLIFSKIYFLIFFYLTLYFYDLSHSKISYENRSYRR